MLSICPVWWYPIFSYESFAAKLVVWQRNQSNHRLISPSDDHYSAGACIFPFYRRTTCWGLPQSSKMLFGVTLHKKIIAINVFNKNITYKVVYSVRDPFPTDQTQVFYLFKLTIISIPDFRFILPNSRTSEPQIQPHLTAKRPSQRASEQQVK